MRTRGSERAGHQDGAKAKGHDSLHSRVWAPQWFRRMAPANRLTTNRTKAMTNRIWAIPAAVEAMPPNPNTAATSATIRNINDQYSIACSLHGGRLAER